MNFTQQSYASLSILERRRQAMNAITDRVAAFREAYGETDPDKIRQAVEFSFKQELSDSPDWAALIAQLIEMFLPLLIKLLLG